MHGFRAACVAIAILLALSAGHHTGVVMTQAEAASQTREVTFPWKGTDDEAVSNIAVGSLRESLLMWLKTERGVHAETLLVSIGSIAGFAALTASLPRVESRDIPLPAGADKSISGEALGNHLRESGLILMATAKSGEKYYFGDLINGYLVQQVTTVDIPLWNLIAGVAIQGGVKPAELPDYKEMFGHTARAIGTPEFGSGKAIKQHPPQLGARQALDLFWPRAKFIMTRTDGPGPAQGRSVPVKYWPFVTAMVAQQFVSQAKDVVDPRVGVALVMEAAIAMSKVDPAAVPQTLPQAQ